MSMEFDNAVKSDILELRKERELGWFEVVMSCKLKT